MTKVKTAKCQKCKKREATDIHHKDENHKNNEPKNLIKICVLCHAKIHGIEPKKSELKRLVILRDRLLVVKNAMDNQIRGFSRIEMEVPEFWAEKGKEIKDRIRAIEKEIKNSLLPLSTHEKNAYPISSWLLNIKGISYNTTAKLISYIDIKNSPSISALWRYCGLDATHVKRVKKISKEEAPKFGNPYLKKEVLGVIGDSFIKQRTPIYRGIYDNEKARQLELLKKCPKVKDERAPKTLNHAHRRAIRKMMKIFISHLWLKWREVEELSVSQPYVIERMGHIHLVPVPA